jgi:hypothetical protein
MRRLETGPVHLVGFSTAVALRATPCEPGLVVSGLSEESLAIATDMQAAFCESPRCTWLAAVEAAW